MHSFASACFTVIKSYLQEPSHVIIFAVLPSVVSYFNQADQPQSMSQGAYQGHNVAQSDTNTPSEEPTFFTRGTFVRTMPTKKKTGSFCALTHSQGVQFIFN